MSVEYLTESSISSNNSIHLNLEVRKELDCKMGDKIIFFINKKTEEIILKCEKKEEIKKYYKEKYK